MAKNSPQQDETCYVHPYYRPPEKNYPDDSQGKHKVGTGWGGNSLLLGFSPDDTVTVDTLQVDSGAGIWV